MIFAWQVQYFVWPGITFSWQAQYFRQEEWKKPSTHRHEAVSSAVNFPFLKEVSQNSFVFDAVNFENWRILADLLRFWCCQVQTLRKSRRIASFLTLSTSKIEQVSQNSFVFKRADGLQVQLKLQLPLYTLHYTYNYTYKYSTLYYTTLITLQLQLQQLLQAQLQLQVQLHYITLHYTNYTTARYNYKYKCTTLHYTNYTTWQYNYNYNCNHNCIYNCTRLHNTTLHYTNYTTLQIQLQHSYTTSNYTGLRYTIPHYSTRHYSAPHYTTLHFYPKETD